MKNKKRLLIITGLIIFVLIVIVMLTVILLNLKNNSQNTNSFNEVVNSENETEIIQENISNEIAVDDSTVLDTKGFFDVEIASVYYAVKGIAENFFDTIKLSSNETYAKSYYKDYAANGMQESKEKLYAILGNEYTISNGINNKNVAEKFSKYNNNVYKVERIKESIKDNNICVFIVYGNFDGTIEYNMAIITDENNLRYMIYPYEYIKNNNINNLNISNIQDKKYNIITYKDIGQEKIVKDYFSDYKYYIQKNSQKIYNKLDSDYRKKRFGTIQEYQEYINDIKKNISNAILKKYKVSNYDNYTEYECIDQNGIHYIFRETSIMQYTLLLDDYTIETEEYKTQYNEAAGADKVSMNISKFIKMINNGDYKQSYEVLNNTFKNKNFDTQDKFKSYIKSKVFDINNLELVNYTVSGENYITEIRLSDSTGKSTDTIEMTIVMQLREGRNFEMSFSFE